MPNRVTERGLCKDERLFLKKDIDNIFSGKDSFIHYPLRIVYASVSTEIDEEKGKVKILTSVSKKKFKRAVDRNRLKRLMKEAYRLNKYRLYKGLSGQDTVLHVALIYLKNELSTYAEIEKSMIKIIDTLIKKSDENAKE